MAKTRQPVKPLQQSAASVRANAAAEKARKAASKKALKEAQAATKAEEQTPTERPPTVEHLRELRTANLAAVVDSLAVDFEALHETPARAEDGTPNPAFVEYLDEQGYNADGSVKLAKTPYNGPMLALKAARKVYVKAANGIQCNGSPLAMLCGQYNREVVVAALIDALKLPNNPYTHLNPGQQSMNLRNKARHAMTQGFLVMGEIEAHLKAHAAQAAKKA